MTLFTDQTVYRKLCDLHLEISNLTIKFPNFEMYELGLLLRGTSIAAPAKFAAGWNITDLNRHTDGIEQALIDVRSTIHYLYIAYRKNYISKKQFEYFRENYGECKKILKHLLDSMQKLAKRIKRSKALKRLIPK